MQLAPLSHMANTLKALRIQNRQRTFADLDEPAAAKLRKHLADVDGGQAGRISNVMLPQRKLHLHGAALGHATLSEPFGEIQEQASYPLIGRAAPEIDDQLIRARRRLRPCPAERIKQIWLPGENRPHVAALEAAIMNVGDSFDHKIGSRIEQQGGR